MGIIMSVPSQWYPNEGCTCKSMKQISNCSSLRKLRHHPTATESYQFPNSDQTFLCSGIRRRFIELCFITLHWCCIFYKLKSRPSISKKVATCFIVILYYSGLKPSPQYHWGYAGISHLFPFLPSPTNMITLIPFGLHHILLA